jgi:CelD/BcsL family acetyltransferase involved in cellulose biosynthesis
MTDPATLMLRAEVKAAALPWTLTHAVTWRIYEDLDDTSTVWKEFQRVAATTLYNTFAWAESWQRHAGRHFAARPRIVVGRSLTGNIQFILPFQLRRASGVTLLEWHGYPDVNYGYGVYAKDFLPLAEAFFGKQLPHILKDVGPHDAVHLHDMPAVMAGQPHPFRRHFNMRAANLTFALRLGADYETVYGRKRVSESRRANQRKDNRLLELGDIRFFTPETAAEERRYIDEMLAQKTLQLAERGVHGVFGKAEIAIMHDLAQARMGDAPLMRTHVVALDGETLAITFGGVVDDAYWFYVSSLAHHPQARKFSPGDYALRKTIEACCSEHLAGFDFGVGDAEYKRGWADDVTPLHMLLRANTAKGFAWAVRRAINIKAKRIVKATPVLMQLATAIRQITKGKLS